jgi:uncharacterized phage protein gp47/JayE
MPFSRPTLTTLRTQAMQDITASDLPNADGFLRFAALRVLAWVQAGLAYLHYGYLDWIARMGTPFTSEDEFLDAWASYAPTPVIRLAPVSAVLTAEFAGTPARVIPAGTAALRQDGFQYNVQNDGTISGGGTASVNVIATDAGSNGNTDNGTPINLGVTIPGINSAGSITATITLGTDLESNDSLRSRMLESYGAPPAGGDAQDYVTWSLQVPAVTRAWCNPNGMGPGTVVVYFMEDVARSAFNGFPQGTDGGATAETRTSPAVGDQLVVANHIYPLQPVTALVYAVAPIATTQAFSISGLSGVGSDVQADVEAALAQMLVNKGSPLATQSIEQSDVDAAIAAVPGVVPFAVDSPSSWPITPALGHLFTLGAVTFT